MPDSQSGRRFESELNELYVSPVLAKALLAADPAFASNEKEVRARLDQVRERLVVPGAVEDALRDLRRPSPHTS